MTRVYLVLMVAACIAGAACFSERSAGPATGECQVPVTVIDSTHFLVAIRAFAFFPDSLNVPTGATVTWVNCEPAGTEPHTTTSTGSAWGSPNMVTGERFSHTFATGGFFPYYCAVHPYMLGKVVVQ